MQQLASGVHSLLFPAACAGCGAAQEQARQEPLCPACLRQMPIQQPPLCYRAGLWALSPWAYEGTARELVLALKYNGRLPLASFLAREMAGAVRERLGEDPADLVAPIPLHPARRRERGFNQAELLAQALARELGIPHRADLLARRRATRPQTELTRRDRSDNVRGAFTLEPGQRLDGLRCLLVDDVLTTGATAAACARLLRAGGTASVTVVTACRD